MTTPGIGQPFPSIPAPFVRVIDDKTKQVIAHGQIEQIWLQLLIALWNRTGGAGGIDSAEALIFAVLSESEGAIDSSSSKLNLASFIQETVRIEVERLGLLCDSSLIANPLLSLLLGDDGGSSSNSSDDDSTSWVPLVTGAEPPVLVSDGAGGLVFVAWHP